MSTSIMGESIKFITRDNIKLEAELFKPQRPKGIIILCHGYAEHFRRYNKLIDTLNAKQYSIYAYNWRGHGNSPGVKGFISSLDNLVSDFEDFVKYVQNLEKEVPLFLLGHSTGGGIVTYYAMTHPTNKQIQGIIVSAPTIVMPVNPILKVFSKWMSVLFPKVALIDGAPLSALSTNPDTEIEARQDPHMYKGKVMSATGYHILCLADQIQAGMETIVHPILIMYGKSDQICDPLGSQLLFDKIASEDRTLQSFEGYHEIFNEVDSTREKVMFCLTEWIDTHLPKS